jgi:putative transposase
MHAFAVGLRREMAVTAVAKRGVGIALACRTFGISESCYRNSPQLGGENEEIADLLIGLTNARKTWGFGLCFLYLRNSQGRVWNHKRVYRITRELELNLRIKPRKRLKRDKPDTLAVPDAPNAVWSIVAGRRCKASPRGDFMADRLGPSRRINYSPAGQRMAASSVCSTSWMTSTARGWASKWISRCRLSGSSAA